MCSLKWFLIIAGISFAGITSFVFWAYPKPTINDYADVTIEKIEVESSGQVLADISTLSSNKISFATAFYDGDSHAGGTIGRDNSGQRHLSGIAFGLNPDGPSITGKWEDAPWAKRLALQAGERRPLRVGERFYFYNFRTSAGIRHYGYIEAESTEKVVQN